MRGLADAERIRTLMAPVGERRPLGPFHPVLLTAALAWAAAVLGAEQAAPAARLDAFVESRHHPAIAYGRGPLEQFGYNILTRYRLRGIDAAIALSPSTVAHADTLLARKITQYIRLPVLDDVAAPRALTCSFAAA